MSQRTRAEAIVNNIKPASEEQLKELRDIVAESQNDQPLGRGDGYINQKAWEALHAYWEAVGEMRNAARLFLETLS